MITNIYPQVPDEVMLEIQKWTEAAFLEIDQDSFLYVSLPQPRQRIGEHSFLAIFKGKYRYDWLPQVFVLLGLKEGNSWNISKIPNEILMMFAEKTQELFAWSQEMLTNFAQEEKNNQARSFLLEHVCSSGLTLQVKDKSEGLVYDEVFVGGEYDLPIKKAIDTGNSTLSIVDLGANSGFFTLRVLDLIADKNFSDVNICLVEGNSFVYKRLLSNLEPIKRENWHISPYLGLVGKRGGSSTFYEKDFHATSSIHGEHFQESTNQVSLEVPFIDLYEIWNTDTIDLLKCDIEGSEQLFLENYMDLLSRTKYAVFEFHPHLCDISTCLHILGNAGLSNHVSLRLSATPTMFFWR